MTKSVASQLLLLLSACCLAAVSSQEQSLIDLSTDSDNTIAKDVEEDVFANCEVYCYGNLLHTIQMAKLFEDSKTFVDMRLNNPPAKTLEDFEALMTAKNNTPTAEDLKKFVDEYFSPKGTELTAWDPTDWKEHPKFLDNVIDADLKQWGQDLNNIWKQLGRKMVDDVSKRPELYSIIPVPNPVIVPGGRFIEFYYWDSYWIVRGLLYCEMYDTVRGMINNFKSMVQRIGFIPNGGRVYYWGRSQPPYLTSMVKSYVEFTNDYQFAIDSLDELEHEFEFFMNNHSVQVKGHDMAVYRDSSTGPRPESYSEDVESAKVFQTDAEKEDHWSELKSAAESGMDFSSRWFIDSAGGNSGNLTNLKCRSVVPVDLNSLLYWNAKLIAEFHTKAGNTAKAATYEEKAQKLFVAIKEVLWNPNVGVWQDFDLINQKHRDYFVPTNLWPLWVKAFNTTESKNISESVLAYIKKNKLDSFPGGVPNTLNPTGEQWDYPNVWAPMQYGMVQALLNLETVDARKLGLDWAYRWVLSNFKAYRDDLHMYEKYNAEVFGGHGGGGEYGVQTGFGWSNGVIIEWLAKYGRELSSGNNCTCDNDCDCCGGKAASHVGSVVGVIAAALALIVAGRALW